MRSARRWCAPLAAAGMMALGSAGTAMAQTEDPDLILRVRADQTAAWGSQAGTSADWSDAYRTLRDGIDAAKAHADLNPSDIVHIWVRGKNPSTGQLLTYYPDKSMNPDLFLENQRAESFILHSRIETLRRF